jgi:hypothetical protein
MYSIKKNNDSKYSLFINNSVYRKDIYEFFILTNYVPFTFIDNNTLFFHAEEICLLDDLLKQQKYKLNQEQCLHLINDIGRQIKYFEKKRLTFLGFNIQDILVLNRNKFLIIATEFIKPFDSFFIDLLGLFEKPYFSSPEIINVKKLPSKIHYKSCYYSLGLLVVFCLFNEYLLKGNEILTMKQIQNILQPIYLSKMYWFLMRCLDENVGERMLLYI